MAEEKREETFRVVDRRLFTPEGELRKEALDSAQADAGQGAVSSAPVAVRNAPAPAPPAQKDSPTPAAAEKPAPSRQFQILVDFLARNAAAMLGGFADPRTGQAILDLDGAREMIDLLDVLREKTRGNLAPEDDQLLLEVIGSLKYSYLEMSKAAAQAMQEKAKGPARSRG